MKKNKKDTFNQLKKNNGGFKIPTNYFNEFENNFQKMNKPKNSGFTIPENYFSQFDDKIIKKINKTDPLHSTGYQVPDNYFDDFKVDLSKKLATKSTKIINLMNYRTIKIISLSIAASLLLYFGFNNFRTEKNKYDIESLQVAEIESWLDEDLISFNSYDIEDTFSDVDLVIENDYSDEILEYLDYSDIENLVIEN